MTARLSVGDDLTLLTVVAGLTDDQRAARALYLAIEGLADLGTDGDDIAALVRLVLGLECRLAERQRQVEQLQGADAARAGWSS